MSEKMVGYYAIIPANVRYDKRLSANAKLLYGEITALSNEKGYCWASNGYFADLYGVSSGSISNWIGNLEKAGYIKRKVIRDKNNAVIRREIYLSVAVQSLNEEEKLDEEERIDAEERIDEEEKLDAEEKEEPTQNSCDTSSKNLGDPLKENYGTSPKNLGDLPQKTIGPPPKNFKDNNTTNNTMNNTNNKRAVVDIIRSYTDDKELLEALKGFSEMRTATRSKLTPRAMKLALNKLDSLSSDLNDKIDIVNQSTMNSWKSFYPLNKDTSKKEDRFSEYNFG